MESPRKSEYRTAVVKTGDVPRRRGPIITYGTPQAIDRRRPIDLVDAATVDMPLPVGGFPLVTLHLAAGNKYIAYDVFQLLSSSPGLRSVTIASALDVDDAMLGLLPTISLPHLEYVHVCGDSHLWRWIRQLIVDVKEEASVHVDVEAVPGVALADQVELVLRTVYNRKHQWIVLPPSSCHVVLRYELSDDCRTVRGGPAYIRVTYAAREDLARLKRDPSERGYRHSFTLRLHQITDTIGRNDRDHNPADVPTESVTEDWARQLLSGFPNRFFSTTEVLIEEGRGGSRQSLRVADVERIFVCLDTWVLEGVPTSDGVIGQLVCRLANPLNRLLLRHVRLPDWRGGALDFNDVISERNPSKRVPVAWST